MHSIKIKISPSQELENYFREFGKIKRIAFNRLQKGESSSQSVNWIKENIATTLDGSFIEFATFDAKNLLESNKKIGLSKIIFGGRENFEKYNKGQISKEDWVKLRNPNLLCVGRAADPQSNRKFKIDIDNKRFIFCPNKLTRIELNFTSKDKRIKKLKEIEILAKSHQLPVTYRLTRDHLILSKKQ